MKNARVDVEDGLIHAVVLSMVSLFNMNWVEREDEGWMLLPHRWCCLWRTD